MKHANSKMKKALKRPLRRDVVNVSLKRPDWTCDMVHAYFETLGYVCSPDFIRKSRQSFGIKCNTKHRKTQEDTQHED